MEAGVRRGGVLFVQCSFNDLITLRDSPFALMSALRQLLGNGGTLLMPAYSTNMQDLPCRPFDVRREPVTTGIVCELFRREPGVIRSLHPRHSICGAGPLAEQILSGHEHCAYADGPGSPFDKLRRMDAQALCLGMAPGFNSFVHWVEDIAPESYPIPAHDGPYPCELIAADGTVLRKPFFRRAAGQRKQEALVGQHLSQRALRSIHWRGMRFSLYFWPALAEELIALRDRGIVYFT